MRVEPNPASDGTSYRAWFQCIAGCPEQYSLKDVIYRCPRCGNLLEVRHDLDRLRQRTPDDWKEIFDKRYLRTQWPYGSGVWGKHEWVCPDVTAGNVVSTFEGGTNLFWAETSQCNRRRLGKQIGVPNLWIKQCGNSHTGSFKDLGMTVLVSMVRQMIAEGKDIPGTSALPGPSWRHTGAHCQTLWHHCRHAGRHE
jgi:threonine synthase